MHPFIQKNGQYIALAFTLLAVLFIFLFTHKSAPRQLTSAYFIDEDTGQESVLPLTQVPPLKGAKHDDSLVRVYKYALDSDPKPHVGYYLKFTPAMKQKLEAAQTLDAMEKIDHTPGTLVRSPDPNGKWVPFSSREGIAITTINAAPGDNITAIFP